MLPTAVIFPALLRLANTPPASITLKNSNRSRRLVGEGRSKSPEEIWKDPDDEGMIPAISSECLLKCGRNICRQNLDVKNVRKAALWYCSFTSPQYCVRTRIEVYFKQVGG